MPLFEYTCRACGRRFEYLMRQSGSPACPACASVEVEKQLSVFAVSAGASSPESSFGLDEAPAPCGTCGDPRGPGSCSIN
jgi:putative FmdB family regulatory protein